MQDPYLTFGEGEPRYLWMMDPPFRRGTLRALATEDQSVGSALDGGLCEKRKFIQKMEIKQS